LREDNNLKKELYILEVLSEGLGIWRKNKKNS
jgi:hypothetical protein